MDVKALIMRITRPAHLICAPCDEDPKRKIQLAAEHSLAPPASAAELAGLPGAQWRDFLSVTNGAVFFHSDGWKYPFGENGLHVFDPETAYQEQRELRKMLAQGIADDPEEWAALCEEAGEDLQAWHQGLVPVAAPRASGDLIVLDTANAQSGQEPPVLFLDHEFYYGGPFSREQVDWTWPDFEAFLEDFAGNPARLLASTWRILGSGDAMDQFYLESVTYPV